MGRRRRKKTSCSSNEERCTATGKEYPLDVWFLISEYIQPEDVSRFAAICKASYSVVCTAKFWVNIYRRFYKFEPNLPEHLKPDCLFRLYGLKTTVVRALHFTYTPFVNRLKTITTFEQHPDVLCKRQCTLMWHEKHKNQWLYYFKLKKKDNNPRSSRDAYDEESDDLLDILDDICANPDENCRILQVVSNQFIPVPPIVGQTLHEAALTLAHGLKNHKLHLKFGSGIKVRGVHLDGTLVVLDPVINVRILDWWHPLYPHNNSLQFLLNRDHTRLTGIEWMDA